MSTVLLVSKALVPPWNDSSKNLARDVAEGLTRYEPVALTDRSGRWAPSRGRAEPIYPPASGLSPGLSAQLRVLAHLVTGSRERLWHLFFAPNPKTSFAARTIARARKIVTVHTVCSRPRNLRRARHLLFADRTVVLSRHTEDALLEAGVPADRLRRVPPAVPPLSPLSSSERHEARRTLGLPIDAVLLLYAGDLELGDGADRTLEAFRHAPRDTILVMACRAKTSGAARAERRLRERAHALRLADRVRWLGETRHILALIGTVDVVALPTTDLYAKMDLPLVLLEAMWLARPVIVAANTPAAELAEGDAARSVSNDEELAGVLGDLLSSESSRSVLGRAARRAAEARYHTAGMVSAYELVYDEVSR